MFKNFFFENRAAYEEKWKNFVELERPQTIIWSMRIKCLIPKFKNTLSEYVILIALVLEQCLLEHASALRSAYIACLAIYCITPLL